MAKTRETNGVVMAIREPKLLVITSYLLGPLPKAIEQEILLLGSQRNKQILGHKDNEYNQEQN